MSCGQSLAARNACCQVDLAAASSRVGSTAAASWDWRDVPIGSTEGRACVFVLDEGNANMLTCVYEFQLTVVKHTLPH